MASGQPAFWMGKSAGNGDGSFPFPLFEHSIAVFDCSRGKKPGKIENKCFFFPSTVLVVSRCFKYTNSINQYIYILCVYVYIYIYMYVCMSIIYISHLHWWFLVIFSGNQSDDTNRVRKLIPYLIGDSAQAANAMKARMSWGCPGDVLGMSSGCPVWFSSIWRFSKMEVPQ